jgi:hypothetical protein
LEDIGGEEMSEDVSAEEMDFESEESKEDKKKKKGESDWLASYEDFADLIEERNSDN